MLHPQTKNLINDFLNIL